MTTPTPTFNSYEQLGELVNGEGGLLPIQMWQLRDIEGAGRLGSTVRKQIGDRLRSHGLGYLAAGIHAGELPSNAHEYVRIYRAGSPIGRLIEAVTAPGPAGDEVLRQAAGSSAAEKLQRIAMIIEE